MPVSDIVSPLPAGAAVICGESPYDVSEFDEGSLQTNDLTAVSLALDGAGHDGRMETTTHDSVLPHTAIKRHLQLRWGEIT